jgi:hypothetical protein
MRATTEWLAGDRGGVTVAVLAAAVADALVAATVSGSLGGTSTGSASLLPDGTASPAHTRPGDPPTGKPLARAGALGGGQERAEAQTHERICAGEMTVAPAAAVTEDNSADEVAR